MLAGRPLQPWMWCMPSRGREGLFMGSVVRAFDFKNESLAVKKGFFRDGDLDWLIRVV
ncbi:hypothetical protein OIU77_013390 [Salix suchowensis]|uniref:Uncharacterized protein n=1 Tax=Salix suchowensis TaxID=1278906 RepID=A0ABQ8ZTW5_9ROSI|nr:hypothetical protein OIU77_013390 [Salix suchowensis]